MVKHPKPVVLVEVIVNTQLIYTSFPNSGRKI